MLMGQNGTVYASNVICPASLVLPIQGKRWKSFVRVCAWYRMLTEVQAAFPRDAAVFKAFGLALLQANQSQEAKIAFDRALELYPSDPINAENAGRADLACGNIEQAAKNLEKALDLDPLLLTSVELLDAVYQRQGESAKEAALKNRIRFAMGNSQ